MRLPWPFNEQHQVEIALSEFRQMREAVGSKLELLIDCAGCFTVQSAA